MSNSLSKIQIAILATIKPLTALAFLATLALATPAQSVQKDIPYAAGGHTRQVLDIHSPKDAQNLPVVFWIHGGGWQTGDKSAVQLKPKAFNDLGFVFVSTNYRLLPQVDMATIIRDVAKAIRWTHDNIAKHGGDPKQIFVMGHSAGGHITGMLMGTDWKGIDARLADNHIKCAIPISPLNELEPLRFTSINDGARMDAAEAASQSPMNNPPLTNAPQLVVCGENETNEFHRQADIYASQFVTPQRVIKRYTVPACDHFDELNQLADEESHFFRASLNLIKYS